MLVYAFALLIVGVYGDVCDDWDSKTRVVIQFNSQNACEKEYWDAVDSITFDKAPKGWTGAYPVCLEGAKREFFWGRKPLHAPWDQWMKHRTTHDHTMVLNPNEDCIESNITACDSTYYKDECSSTGGIVTGSILLSIVVILAIIIAIKY